MGALLTMLEGFLSTLPSVQCGGSHAWLWETRLLSRNTGSDRIDGIQCPGDRGDCP